MKKKIEIEVSNIDVDDFYYSFDYVVLVDGIEYKKETYESDHVWRDDKDGFKKVLRNGVAFQTIIENLEL